MFFMDAGVLESNNLGDIGVLKEAANPIILSVFIFKVDRLGKAMFGKSYLEKEPKRPQVTLASLRLGLDTELKDPTYAENRMTDTRMPDPREEA